MELKTYLTILWRRKWIIGITTAVTVAVVTIGTFMMTPTYVASTTLRVATAPGGSASYTDVMYATRLMNTYAKLVTTRTVLDALAQRLGLEEPPKIGMEMLGNTEFMRLTVEHPNPQLAQAAANAMAEILIDLNRELYVEAEVTAQEILSEQLARVESELNQAKAEYESAVDQTPVDWNLVEAASRALESKQRTFSALLEQREEARVREVLRSNALSVFEPADLPVAPSKPRKKLNAALGLMVGLVGGVGLGFLFENLDTRLHTVKQIEEVTALPTFGKIPSSGKGRTIAFSNGRSPAGEAYRRLRTTLFAYASGVPKRTLLVTSAEPGEGKSTTVANLAIAMGLAGHSVIAVDADLRRPILHEIFDLSNETGLSDILSQKVALEHNDVVQDSHAALVSVLTSGPVPPNPVELLGSPQMTALLERLKQQYDVILMDTPALVAVADAAVLAPLVDAVLLVVGRAQARVDPLQAACQQLAEVKAGLVGVVVNREKRDGSHHYSKYYK